MSAARYLFTGILLAVLPVIGAAASGGELLGGSLGRWLDETAGPELAETLARHPKFKGETVRFVPMLNGRTESAGNRLVQAVEQRLTGHLIRAEGVRIAWARDPQPCAAPEDVPYLVGIEIHKRGSDSYHLNIAMVDVDEGVWVNGVSLAWKGRLLAAERAALATRVNGGPPGSMENPLALGDSRVIGELMLEGLGCAIPAGLDGSLYVAMPADSALSGVAQALTRQLSVRPLAAVTIDRAQASWEMALTARPLGNGADELVATLSDLRRDDSFQQIASVVISRPRSSRPEAATPLGMPAALLSGLSHEMARSRGVCQSSAGPGGCVEVSFDLLRPAYLLVVSSRDERLESQVCGRSLRIAQPGPRRYRLRVPSAPGAPGRPDAGIYVLAVEKRSVAHRIARQINAGPGACPGGVRESAGAWLQAFSRLLTEYRNDVDWRAAHFHGGPGGITRI
ncbi:MAG: hypothetical protein GWM88_10920 [Pseudomonadales bacterium]|nr:hypothetical protein [Pseudomonadales bacterium]NIX08481.1 hypothetical protein [Pseudomonadales bacterium]